MESLDCMSKPTGAMDEILQIWSNVGQSLRVWRNGPATAIQFPMETSIMFWTVYERIGRDTPTARVTHTLADEYCRKSTRSTRVEKGLSMSHPFAYNITPTNQRILCRNPRSHRTATYESESFMSAAPVHLLNAS